MTQGHHVRGYRRALLAGAAVAIISTSGAVAQQAGTTQAPPPASEQAGTMEEMVITGSRIRRSQFDLALPTTTIGAVEIEQRAFTNTIEALNELPFVGPGPTRQGANTQFGDNFSFVDLFNLGTNRTLSLVNGRRFVPSNQGTVFVPDNATGAQVDYTVINPAFVERIEVLRGTGGSIYGADAVSGVVNVILKEKYEGFEVLTQGGLTEYGDGGSYRVNVAAGETFLDGRLNVALAGEYNKEDLIRGGQPRDFLDQIASFTNPLNGGIRNPAALNANDAITAIRGGQALPPAFLLQGSDQQSSLVFSRPSRNPFLSVNGTLVTSSLVTGSTNVLLVPTAPVAGGLAGRAGDPANFATFAPSSLPSGVNATAVIRSFAPTANLTGLTNAQLNSLALNLLQQNRPTPAEFFRANPGTDPLLFIGSFGTVGLYPEITNPNAATRGIFPTVAVPLQFDAAGNLVPFNIGTIAPFEPGTSGQVIGGDGYSASEFGNLASSVERTSANFIGSFDVTENIRLKQEFLYADLTFDSVGGPNSNGPTGSTTGGSRSVPIYIDQNPFFNQQNRDLISSLQSQGLTLPTIAGQTAPGTTTPARVLYLSKVLLDLQGESNTGNRVDTYRSSTTLEGDFATLNRDFYWDVNFVYGRTNITNVAEQILDIEFALAADAVVGPDGRTVCRQQTLAAPEPISVRDPALSGINTLLSLTPTAEQVAACVPINLFGRDGIPDEAIRNIVVDAGSNNVSEQFYGAFNFGGEIVELPAGPLNFGASFEWRREELLFSPSENFTTGAARNTSGTSTDGGLRFFEGGYEIDIPVFGKDFNFLGMHGLTLNGSARAVSRSQFTTNTFFAEAPGTLDVTFAGGGTWNPIEDVSIRGNRSRSVRSASIVELFGSPQTAFTTLGAGGSNPCTTSAITLGPNPAVRRANCIEAVQLLGIASSAAEAETFLSTFLGTAGGRPAATVGNAFLQNERANNWSVGFTYEPDFVENLSISLDYQAINLTGQISLAGPGVTANNCFDQEAFPESQIAGLPLCDQSIFGVPGPAGNFIVPAINPLTGNPTPPLSQPGQAAAIQAPFELAFVQFPNLNLGATEFRSMTGQVQYAFDIEDVLGSSYSAWGTIRLNGIVQFVRRFDTSATGTFADINPNAGEPGNERYQTRMDVTYDIGGFTGTLQWFRTSAAIVNLQTPPESIPEQSVQFFIPSFNSFNLNLQYAFTDQFVGRLVVNNLTDSVAPEPEFGNVADTFGRQYVATLQYRF